MSSVSDQMFFTRSIEARIATLGAVLTIVGITVHDTLGASTTLAAFGIGLFLTGVTCSVIDAPVIYRYAAAFGVLVAAQLLLFSGILRLIGALGICIVLCVAAYSHLRE